MKENKTYLITLKLVVDIVKRYKCCSVGKLLLDPTIFCYNREQKLIYVWDAVRNYLGNLSPLLLTCMFSVHCIWCNPWTSFPSPQRDKSSSKKAELLNRDYIAKSYYCDDDIFCENLCAQISSVRGFSSTMFSCT